MFHHQRDEFIVAEIFPAETKLTRDGLTRSQNLSRPEAHFPEQLAELLFAERLEIIIDLFEVNATLTEQLVQFATLGSSGLFVNCNHKNVLW